MNEQFIFFCVNIGNENLLKEEIKSFYPELTISYSRKGFLTFKNKGVKYDFNTIAELKATFSTRTGICLGRAHPDNFRSTVTDTFKELGLELKECMIHNFSINTEYEFDAATDFGLETNEYSAEGKLVLNTISLGEKEVWFGLHRVGRGITRYPNSQVEVVSPESAPSVAYRKIAEISILYGLKFTDRDSVLDFGCCPGGSIAYFLASGAKVWGIDTAVLTDKAILSHKNLKFIKSSVQDLSHEKLPNIPIDWVHADININPKQSIKEVLRLCKKFHSSLRGVIFTVPVVKIDYIKNIEEFEDMFYDWGFSYMISCQAPSHKKEYVLIARKKLRS